MLTRSHAVGMWQALLEEGVLNHGNYNFSCLYYFLIIVHAVKLSSLRYIVVMAYCGQFPNLYCKAAEKDGIPNSIMLSLFCCMYCSMPKLEFSAIQSMKWKLHFGNKFQTNSKVSLVYSE